MAALLRAKAVDFDGLYRRHAPSVYRYAFAVLGNQADAEDVTQQTFLNAYRAIEQGTKPRKAENWLLRIAHNEVRRHFRKNGSTVEIEYDDHVAEPAHDPIEPTLADLLRALRRLPPTQRAALVMREFEGRSYAEMAEILEVSQSALEALLFRARRGLAAELEDALTCGEAEHAISRRLDGRLRRRESRRLKEHLRDCVRCVRFATLQKRQRSLLKGLSIMPIPASLLLFRGEHAAAAGLGSGAVAAGSGAGVTVVAKAAAVTAAVAVTGGVGYGVATDQKPAPTAAPKAVRAAAPPVVVRQRVSATQMPVAATRRGPRVPPVVAPKPLKAKSAKKAKPRAKKAGTPLSAHRPVSLDPTTEKQPKLPRPKSATAKPRPSTPGRAKKPVRKPKPSPAPRGRTKPRVSPPKADPTPRGRKEPEPPPPAPPAEDPPKKPKP